MTMLASPVKSCVVSRLVRNWPTWMGPVAVIENATARNMRVLRGPIAGLADLVAREKVKSPALIIVGEVAGEAEQELRTLALEFAQ